MTEENQVIEFVTINEYPDYEILNQYPFTIRRKDNKYVVTERINKNNGYVSVNINSNKINKHQIIAKQFLYNDDPEHKIYVDHISRNRADYHLSNLRWCTASENIRNASSRNGVEYVFVDNIPNDSIVITHYDVNNKRRYFEENKYYYYYNEETEEDVFYQRITDNVYRIMYINTAKGGRKCIMTRDINNKKTTLYIRSFKYQYDLI
ncbi:hypothetical protein M9Y10_013459 [Tritrichomonas musculus]|uniref:HNH nuclease domain-containing protein n=1 Tax=Tritrichomonas musculus TaxID=1915356 RepID=A0ABR2I7A5_9EUKA